MSWQKLAGLDWMASFQQFYQRVPVSTVNRIAAVLLVVLLAWLTAKLSWLFWPQPTAAVVSSAGTAVATTPAATVSLDAIINAKLFGAYQEKPTEPVAAPTVTDAPQTSLNARLTGLVFARQNPQQGSAVIEFNGIEQFYSVDEQIEGSQAVLKQVLEDRVLISHNGRLETLMLDGVEYQQLSADNAGFDANTDTAAGVIEQGPAPDQINAMRREILNEPAKFFDYIRISPRHRNGQLYGYALLPGRDPAVFNSMGLLPNDVAIEINGVRLDDMQQAYGVINDLREARQASIKIERDGEIRDVQVTLSAQ